MDVHVAAALDANGGTLGVESFPTTTVGFADLHTWLSGFGTLGRVGVEGTGAYGPAWPGSCVVLEWRGSRLIAPIVRHATKAVLRTICRPAAPTLTATSHGLIRACPQPEWPITGLPAPSPKLTLDVMKERGLRSP